MRTSHFIGAGAVLSLGIASICLLRAPVRADAGEDGTVAGAPIGPDVIVSRLSTDGSSSLGQEGSISAFAVATRSCNIGDQGLDWFPSPGSNQHPAIGQGLFRLREDRFTQIGLSWVKHGFFALNESFGSCGVCTSPDGNILHPGCSDPYSASLNGGRQYLGPTWEINADTGFFPGNHESATSFSGNIANRLQARNTDIDQSQNPGAMYFAQGQYVHPDDAFAGNGNNNASYAAATFVFSGALNRYIMNIPGTTEVGSPAIRAWKDQDATVVETDAQVPGEGLFILATKAIELGDGYWRYEYALQNLNSDRSAGSFSVPVPEGATVRNAGFHDVDYHDGDGIGCPGCVCVAGTNAGQPCVRDSDCAGGGSCSGSHINFDGTDWEPTIEVESITWATIPYATNPNANALRWSTLYNFWFETNVGPGNPQDPEAYTTAIVGLFKPGFPTDIAIRTRGPLLDLIDCNSNEIPDSCDVNCAAVGCSPPCGGSADCAPNGVPDECEDDCNENGIPDLCDIQDGTSEDCQPNTVPDECEPDCDGDGIIDACETVLDTDGDGVEDCADLCPETTPVGACIPDLQQIVYCCFSNGLAFGGWTWGECETFCTNDPDPERCGPVCDDPPACPGTPCPESFCRDGCLMGDFDRDGDLDLADVAFLEECFSGATGNPAYVTPSPECALRFDYEPDSDVDMLDYEEFHANFTGP